MPCVSRFCEHFPHGFDLNLLRIEACGVGFQGAGFSASGLGVGFQGVGYLHLLRFGEYQGAGGG